MLDRLSWNSTPAMADGDSAREHQPFFRLQSPRVQTSTNLASRNFVSRSQASQAMIRQILAHPGEYCSKSRLRSVRGTRAGLFSPDTQCTSKYHGSETAWSFHH